MILHYETSSTNLQNGRLGLPGIVVVGASERSFAPSLCSSAPRLRSEAMQALFVDADSCLEYGRIDLFGTHTVD